MLTAGRTSDKGAGAGKEELRPTEEGRQRLDEDD